MLKEFSVKNFLSFKEEVIFSMEALVDSVSEYPKHVVNINNNELLKVASIYGPNGSGKSNLLKAFNFFSGVVLGGRASDTIKNIHNYMTREDKFLIPFQYDSNNDNLSTFKYFSVNEDFEIGYELVLLYDEFNNYSIYEEILSYKMKDEENYELLFHRVKDDIKLYDDLKELIILPKSTISSDITLLNFIYSMFLKDDKERNILLEVIRFLFREILLSRHFKSIRNTKIDYVFLKVLLTDEEFRREVVKLMKTLDLGIEDIKIVGNKDNEEIYITRLLNGKYYDAHFDMESDGTKKLLSLMDLFVNNIGDEKIVFIDEIDTHLHPKLTRAIIQLFMSDKNKKTQLIFTSHDIVNMDNDLFRRDEIWFTVKDEDLSTNLFSLTDIVNYKGEKIRKDAKFGKQYLEGRYGADPFIRKGVEWNG